MNNLLAVSSSPHIRSNWSVSTIMLHVCLAMLPATALSVYFFGTTALWIIIVSIISCLAVEYLIERTLLKRNPNSIEDLSAVVTGILLALNLPPSLPLWQVVIGAIVAIGVGKMSFGGIGQNPFNPALVGRVFLLISFPEEMTSWTKNLANPDITSGATPLGLIKEGLGQGEKSLTELLAEAPSLLDMFWGKTGGSLGEVSVAAILLGGLYLLYRRVITWHIPVAVLVGLITMACLLWLINSEIYLSPLFHLMAGGTMLGAWFMATDYSSSPMSIKGMLIFGLCIGIVTICIRTFGAYPEGMSFAILVMNGFVPLLNRFRPKRFGMTKG